MKLKTPTLPLLRTSDFLHPTKVSTPQKNMKLFQLTVPNPKVPQFLSLLDTEFGLGDNLMTMESFKSTLIQFRVEDDHVHFVLTELQALGLGISFGFCDVLDLKASTTVPAKALRQEATIQSTEALAPSQIYSNIVKKAVLTVDTVIIIVMSAAMAGIGLAINNSLYILAGSLLSRLMGPVMGASYGLAILDKEVSDSEPLHLQPRNSKS